MHLILFFLAILCFGTFSDAAQKSAKSTPANRQQKTPASKKGANSTESTKQPETIKIMTMPSAAASILVAYAPDSKSHLRSMLPLVNRLASDGHNITIFYITSEKKDEKMHPGIGQIRVQLPDLKAALEKEMGERLWKDTLHSPGLPIIYEKLGPNFVQLVVDHPEKLTKLLNSKWDLVMLDELFTIHGYAFAQMLFEHRRVPFVIFSPAMMMSSAAYANAIGHSPITHPHPFSPSPSHSTDSFEPSNVWHRIVNLLETLGDLGAAKYIDNIAVAPRTALLTGKTDFSFAKLYANSEMSIVDSIAYLAYPQPEVTEVLNAGAHCEEAKELPEEYREFVEDPLSKGTIYAAFGTFIPWDYAPPQVVKAFFDAFERLSDYRIIFSFRGKFPLRKLSPHIRLVSWAPQLDLLAHPKTKVFLTHCGLKSIKESLCSKTPMLAMPMFAEQNHNAFLVLKFGTGLALNKFNIDAEQLYKGLKELLDNPKYGDRVAKLQRIFLDRPMPALDQGAYFVRRIIKKGEARMGRHFFDCKGIQLNFLEYSHFDLLIFFTSIALFIAWK